VRDERFPIAVLVSGTGTNLQAILDQVHGRDGIEVATVISSRASAKALERAARSGVESAVFEAADYPDRSARDAGMVAHLEERSVALVVLAGFMELLTPVFLNAFTNRVINVHPSLLPAFPGANPIEDQLAYGAKIGGVTVHFVDEGVDSGPIILQEPVPLPASRDREEMLARVHEKEHELLPRAIRLVAGGGVSIDAGNPRVVNVDERVLTSPEKDLRHA
jgi:phosphoribosylglycinamide formyltransferase-1